MAAVPIGWAVFSTEARSVLDRCSLKLLGGIHFLKLSGRGHPQLPPTLTRDQPPILGYCPRSHLWPLLLHGSFHVHNVVYCFCVAGREVFLSSLLHAGEGLPLPSLSSNEARLMLWGH